MERTPASLIERPREPNEQQAWRQFVALFTPLLFSWARRVGLSDADAADLVQDVLTTLVQKLPEFRYDASRSFRAWLKTILLNRWRENRRRASVPLQGLGPEPAVPDDAAVFSEDEYHGYLVTRALQVMQTDFQPATWKAFWECTAYSRPAAQVAAELGLSVKAVYLAKARVLRLRQELDGLLD